MPFYGFAEKIFVDQAMMESIHVSLWSFGPMIIAYSHSRRIAPRCAGTGMNRKVPSIQLSLIDG